LNDVKPLVTITTIALFQIYSFASEDRSSVERFKLLLSSPPVIKSMVYSRTLPAPGQTAAFIDTGLNGSTNREFFEIRWQTNAFFHRQLIAPEQVTNNTITGRCFKLWNDQFYFFDSRTAPSLYVLEWDKAARGVYPGPYHAAHIRMTEASQPLTLGISHIYPGMISWEDDRFTVVTMADRKPNWIRGRITGFSNGVPSELKVQYSNDMGVANYRITYDYADEWAAGYPSRIAAHFVNGEREILYSELFILSVKISQAALPEDHFSLASTVMAPDRMLYLTNDSVYARLPSGRLIEAPGVTRRSRFDPGGYHRNRYYYAAAGAWTICCFALGVRTRKTMTALRRTNLYE
jgi:hypothetical protein